ncbi:MAG: Hydroxymethylpyrimidine phosphate kinase ThiD [Rhodospirillales bacterium]|nr:Hydroxymethylpyrimidine phosphate kinase ThiD [Rhodospirillales bacterium]
MIGRVLVVAGSDSGAGAGIQADIKAIAALGGYATTAVTAITAQNTRGVHDIMRVPPAFVRRQMEVVLDDIGADCLKTGMLHDAAILAVVVDIVRTRASDVPLVVDPVLIASDGTRLMDEDALKILKRDLIPLTTILTPNAPEAAALTGLAIDDLDAMQRAAEALVRLGARSVLVKGGHVDGDSVRDVFWDGTTMSVLESLRIATRHTHGTGCTLASAIAAGLAQGMAPLAAIRRARAYLTEALRTAPGLGQGHGPMNHMHGLTR